MLNHLIDPVAREYLLLNSRLRQFGSSTLLLAIVGVLLVLAYFGWLGVIGTKNIFEILVWIPHAVLGSILGYLLIAFLDRERRVRFFHFASHNRKR